MNQERFDQTMELMKYYQDEFKMRQKHFWELLIKLFTLDTIVALLPFAKAIAGIELTDSLNHALFIFPIVGILIAFFSLALLRAEAKRITYVNRAKYRQNEKLPEDCQYKIFEDLEKNGVKKLSGSKIRNLSKPIPWIVFVFELAISVTALVFCIIMF